MLNQHPSIFAWYELLNPSNLAKWLAPRDRERARCPGGTRPCGNQEALCICYGKQIDGQSIVDSPLLPTAIDMRSHQDVMRDLPLFMRRYWTRFCPQVVPSSGACGFKVFPGHVVSPARLPQLLQGSPHRSVRAIVLERQDVTSEYWAVRNATVNRNWGTNPAHQQRNIQRAPEPSTSSPAAATADFERFAREHREWFEQVHSELAREEVPTLRISFERLVRNGPASTNEAMAAALAFLGQPPLSSGRSFHALYQKIDSMYHRKAMNRTDPACRCACQLVQERVRACSFI